MIDTIETMECIKGLHQQRQFAMKDQSKLVRKLYLRQRRRMVAQRR